MAVVHYNENSDKSLFEEFYPAWLDPARVPDGVPSGILAEFSRSRNVRISQCLASRLSPNSFRSGKDVATQRLQHRKLEI